MIPYKPDYELDQVIEDTIDTWIEAKHKDDAEQLEFQEEESV